MNKEFDFEWKIGEDGTWPNVFIWKFTSSVSFEPWTSSF